MDSVKQRRVQATKSYDKSLFVYNLLLHALAALACTLCSSSYWFPSLSSSMWQFLFISLPRLWSYFSNPKCLFVVVNVIVAFLVGESKLLSSNASCPTAENIHDEYVKIRRRSVKAAGASNLQEKVHERKEENHEINITKKTALIIRVEAEKEVREEYKDAEEKAEVEEDDDSKKETEEEEEGEEHGLPAEELNKRIEAFIARVNKQRWLEARSLVCCKA